MSDKSEMMPVEQAALQVTMAMRLLARLHLAFSETVIDELGPERGRAAIVRSIRRLGQGVADELRKSALERGVAPDVENVLSEPEDSYPMVGTHDRYETLTVDGQQHTHSYGCVLAKLWKEFGREDLGRLYCLVDTAGAMAYDPNMTCVHVQDELDGDPLCEVIMRPAMPEEREAWERGEGWEQIDLKYQQKDARK